MSTTTLTPRRIDFDDLRQQLTRLRGDPALAPDGSVIIPVNAQCGLENVLQVVSDIAAYAGPYSVEVILVINNYPPDAPPPEIEHYSQLGMRVVSVPNVWRSGEPPGFTARFPGLRAAASENALLFDADCRIPSSSALIDWYIKQLNSGAKVAYTHVAYYDFPDRLSVHARIFIHHFTRWVKRNILNVPTTRGSNYAVHRSTMVDLYDRTLLADEMNTGPAIKATGGKVAYSSAKDLYVYTSGRMFFDGWLRIMRYVRRRLLYNLRVLPVRSDASRYSGREKDPMRRYLNNRPVRDEKPKT